MQSSKRGSSVGRVLMPYSSSSCTLENYYVGGSGVGAVGTSNRNALRRKATWRPIDNGKGSKRCSGFCQPNRFANNVNFIMPETGGSMMSLDSHETSTLLQDSEPAPSIGSTLLGSQILLALGTQQQTAIDYFKDKIKPEVKWTFTSWPGNAPGGAMTTDSPLVDEDGNVANTGIFLSNNNRNHEHVITAFVVLDQNKVREQWLTSAHILYIKLSMESAVTKTIELPDKTIKVPAYDSIKLVTDEDTGQKLLDAVKNNFDDVVHEIVPMHNNVN